MYGVEDFADNVERRYQVGTTVTYEDTYFFASLGFQGIVTGNRTYMTVKYDVFRLLFDGFVHIEVLQAFIVVFAFSVEVALYNIKFFIHFRQAAFRFDQNQTIHTVCNVHTHRCDGAVVDIQTRL